MRKENRGDSTKIAEKTEMMTLEAWHSYIQFMLCKYTYTGKARWISIILLWGNQKFMQKNPQKKKQKYAWNTNYRQVAEVKWKMREIVKKISKSLLHLHATCFVAVIAVSAIPNILCACCMLRLLHTIVVLLQTT